jgi:hypothetical protein
LRQAGRSAKFNFCAFKKLLYFSKALVRFIPPERKAPNVTAPFCQHAYDKMLPGLKKRCEEFFWSES